MKKSTKFLSLALSGLMMASMAVACGRVEDGGDPNANNENLSQLKVLNYEGGFGRVWLDKAAERFEEKYKDVSFEDGKTGVNIQIESSINSTAGSSLIANAKTHTAHVFFTEDVLLYSLTAAGAAADITDIVTGSLSTITDGKETGSIADKFDDSIGTYYELGEVRDASGNKTQAGKYYALPHYSAPKGVFYDVDLFNEKGLWLDNEGNPFGYETTQENEDIGTGPDGELGTYDDGLPRTFAEFFALCDYMMDPTGADVIPFTWAGAHDYPTSALAEIWADFEGKDQFYLNFSMEGTATTLIDEMGANGKPVSMMPATQIDGKNAFLLQRQQGKYVALEFAEAIAKNGYYSEKAKDPTESNIMSQRTYLESNVMSNKKPIAFFFEGVWWENEADENGHFRDLSIYGKGDRSTRKFGWLPYPKYTEDMVHENNRRTIYDTTNNSCAFIRSTITDENIMKLAKTFLQFCYTDNELQEFTVNTSTLKPVNYEIPTDKMARMSYFGRDVASLINNPRVDYVYTFSDHPNFVNHVDLYYIPDFAWGDNMHNNNPMRFFGIQTGKAATIKQKFDAMVADRENTWNTKFNTNN